MLAGLPEILKPFSCPLPLGFTLGRPFPTMTVDKVVKRYAFLRRQLPELKGTVFHSTRKWFITQCERTGTPEYFTATLVGYQSARSENMTCPPRLPHS